MTFFWMYYRGNMESMVLGTVEPICTSGLVVVTSMSIQPVHQWVHSSAVSLKKAVQVHGFFLTYAWTLYDEIPLFILVCDHIATKHFNPTSSINKLRAFTELEQRAVSINKWMNTNKLKKKAKKSEFILFASQTQLENVISKRLTLQVIQ